LFSKNGGMKKHDYIRTTQDSANQRIWDFISLRYQSIARRNILLGGLWMIAASMVFGCIAVIGWLSSFSKLFKDLRFTPHYLRSVISSLRMTEEQTRSFLDATVLDYKKRLSYGNISLKEQKRIETMFELLYAEFEAPETDNRADVVENIQTLTQAVTESSNELKTISNYAAWKQTVEKEEFERKQQLQDQQTKRSAAVRNRGKGRMLNCFEDALTDEHLDTLVNCCNDISMFTRDIEAYEMQDILSCSHSEPLQVNVNKHLAVLFDKLREHGLICKTWMSVAERHGCFVSKQGKPITSKDLSAALSTASLIKQEIEEKINECMDAIIHSE
jgi:hypothetical protein